MTLVSCRQFIAIPTRLFCRVVSVPWLNSAVAALENADHEDSACCRSSKSVVVALSLSYPTDFSPRIP